MVLFGSCNATMAQSKRNYDIEINYLSTPVNDNRSLPNDSITLCFAGNYDKDTIEIYVNDKFYNKSIRTTDEVVGMAGDLTLPDYRNIEKISIRINSGKLILIETEKKHYNILLDFVDNKATIKFYRKLPGFM
jgi:menaquinone-dependent protoporphyrinogen IX oxidase